jgi:hypothetical protein
MTQMLMPPLDDAGSVAGWSDEELAARMDEAQRLKASAEGVFAVCLAEASRREMFLAEGATSRESWMTERFGISVASARALSEVADRVRHLPHMVGSLCRGDISFDKVRVVAAAVAASATPAADEEFCKLARVHSVRELADAARSTAPDPVAASSSAAGRSEYERRYLRFNDRHRTMSLQLPAEAYAQTRACIDSWTAKVPSDDETPLDQRRCDGFLGMVDAKGSTANAANPFFVVAHVPLDTLVEGGEPGALAGELEHDGLIDVETVTRLACDATVVVAVDDEAGHTMYEGRARRFPSGAQRREVIRRDRHCRFPGCSYVTFTNVHHIVPWKPGGGTDLPNLVLLCRHHHGVVHRKGWSLSGDANAALTFVGPTGRIMVSRPSPLWSRISAIR